MKAWIARKIRTSKRTPEALKLLKIDDLEIDDLEIDDLETYQKIIENLKKI